MSLKTTIPIHLPLKIPPLTNSNLDHPPGARGAHLEKLAKGKNGKGFTKFWKKMKTSLNPFLFPSSVSPQNFGGHYTPLPLAFLG